MSSGILYFTMPVQSGSFTVMRFDLTGPTKAISQLDGLRINFKKSKNPAPPKTSVFDATFPRYPCAESAWLRDASLAQAQMRRPMRPAQQRVVLYAWALSKRRSDTEVGMAAAIAKRPAIALRTHARSDATLHPPWSQPLAGSPTPRLWGRSDGGPRLRQVHQKPEAELRLVSGE